MLLVPRKCFKTTLGSISLPILLLAIDPNLRILITAHVWEFAKEILDGIRNHLERNEKFKEMFGDWKKGATMWSDEAITIGSRTDPNIKEPSIATAGVDKAKTGGAYDFIIADDLHSEKNIETEGMRRKVRRHIQTLYPILEPTGALLIIGTRWHNSDAYNWLIQRDEEFSRKGQPLEYTKLIRSAYLPDGRLYFPEQLSEEFLSQARRNLEDKLYAVWYLNQSMEEGSRIFPRSWWQFWDGEYSAGYYPTISTEKGGTEPVFVTMAIDPAYTGQRGSDSTGVTVVGTSPGDNWYVMEAKRFKGGPEQTMSAITLLVTRYRPRVVTIETVFHQEIYRLLFAQLLKERGLRIPVRPYTESNRKSKAARIEGLQPRFKQRKIFLRRGLDDLYQELEDYPELLHDDLLDSLAQHLAISRPARPDEYVILDEEELEDGEEKEVQKVLGGFHVGLGTPDYSKKVPDQVESMRWMTLKGHGKNAARP
jgi:predicted phage terminase large subunit-like protein